MATKIVLENGEHLECADGVVFPIELKIQDIKDISKRTTSHSKTIRLVGSKNNIKVLGFLYDVNVVNSSFNINKKLKADVYQDGVNVFPNCYFQLRHVIKSSSQSQRDTDKVDFEGLVFKSTFDLFSKIDGKEVSDLRVNTPTDTHTLTRANIVASWSHDWEDKYVYPTFYKDQTEVNGALVDSNVYDVPDFKPSIFGRTIFDAIHEEAGFLYEWDSINDSDVNFNKLIYPFNAPYTASQSEIDDETVILGTDLTPDPNDSSPLEEDFPLVPYAAGCGISEGGYFLTQNLGATVVSNVAPNEPPITSVINLPDSVFTPAMHTFVNVIKDNNSQYSGGVYTPPQTGEVDIFVSMDLWEINIETLGASQLFFSSNDASKSIQYQFAPFVRVKPIGATPPYTFYYQSSEYINKSYYHGNQLASGNNITTGSYNGKITVDLKSGDTIELLGVAILVSTQDVGTGEWIAWGLQSGGFTNVTPKFRAFDVNVKIVPQIDYKEGLNINIDDFLPRKYKQSEFIKDVCNLFNLMVIPDETIENKVHYIKRDDYYDDGEVRDLSANVDNSKEKVVTFLPEVNAKTLTLSYSNDNDEFNTLYQNGIGKTYGQLSYILENEFVKGEDRRELKLAPTPVGKMRAFGGYAPFIPLRIQKDIKPRVLYYRGIETTSWFYIQEADGTLINTNGYGAAHHFNDPINPSFDLNYGVCDYYFHPDITITLNNLFNLHYRRTFNQINEGKLMKLHLVLNEKLKSDIKLNDKIRINNSMWHINTLSFDANSDRAIAELFSIDNELSVNVVKRSTNTQGGGSDPILGDNPYHPPIEGRPPDNNDFGGGSGNTWGGYNDGSAIRGDDNYLGSSVKSSIIIGNDNEMHTSKSMAVGDGMVVTKKGLNAENIIVHKSLTFNDGRDFEQYSTYKITMDRSEIVGLHADPHIVLADDLGIRDLGTFIPLKVLTKVFTDGSNFTGSRSLSIVNETVGIPAPYAQRIVGRLELETTHFTYNNLNGNIFPPNEGFQIITSGAIGGAGDDAFVEITVYYKII